MIRIVASLILVWLGTSALAQGPHAGFEPREGRRHLAFNLADLNDWSTQAPFIDVMRTARAWIGHRPGQWGGMDEAELRDGGFLDDDGWMLRVPPALSHVSTLVLTDLPAEMTSMAGRYHARWEGSAPLGFGGAARNVRYAGRSASFDFAPGAGAVSIEFRRGDLRNLSVVHERHLDAFERGEIFNPDWLARIGDAENLRFMDWMRTNNATMAHWHERPRPEDYTWARNGVPLEVMLALANQTGAEPWFTLPHLADDDFVRRFTEAVRDGLRPDLRAWIEFSNEVWNWSFAQADWAEQNARARWGQEWAWVQFYALRAAQVMDIAAEVFAESPERLVRVLGIFTGWLGLEQDILNAPLWQAEAPGNRAPHHAFDAYAVTGYFSAELHTEERQPMLRDWLAESAQAAGERAEADGLAGAARDAFIHKHRFDLALERAGRELLDGGVSGQRENSVRHLLEHTLAHHARAAAAHDLALVMYEGGTHVVVEPAQHDNAELVAFFAALNYSAEMGALYRALIEGWNALTPAPFNAYSDIYAPTIWGSWGALRHLDDANPRWQALMDATQP
ncbi:MAG: hypothetical protein ACK4LQ_05315 [Pararhodobacter sp.]